MILINYINKYHSISLILLLSLFIFENQLFADVLCQSEITYKWSREKSSNEQPTAPKVATPEPAKTSESSVHELTVFWKNVEQKSEAEEDAKQKIAKMTPEERANAERACLTAHENLAGCISTKFSNLTATFSTLSFNARKAMEDAIKQDCTNQQGKCMGSAVSDVKCSDIFGTVKPTEIPTKDKNKKK